MTKDKNLGIDVSHVMDKALNDLERLEIEFAIETATFGGITGKATAFIKRRDEDDH